jgi:hypothetical protein
MVSRTEVVADAAEYDCVTVDRRRCDADAPELRNMLLLLLLLLLVVVELLLAVLVLVPLLLAKLLLDVL